MKRIKASLIIMLAAMMTCVSLFAENGDDILNKVEKTLTGAKDYEGTAEMTLANSDGSGRETRVLKLWIAGKDKRVIKFLSPAGIKGIGLLSPGEDSMYLYLPAQNKIRMIQGNVKNENFQGTDFSYNEMGSYEYRKDFNAQIQNQEGNSCTLLLTKKPGSDREYDKLIMVVNTSNYVPEKMELYANERLKKILTISEVRTSGSYIVPSRIKMEDVEKKHYTEMLLKDLRFDQDLESSSVFSKRFLKKRVR